ncbi:citrate/2-methylcitrate synthase [Geochorda subterranea]|uniref:citrate/2-methylcitrate synthase n=1 Tax=Geochorda subterranea TaxID=3109564 RepID=UPI00386021F2
MSEATQIARGLEGVVVARSSISYVDGRQGRLIYQGYDIRDLAEHATFEEVCFLLWHGRLPDSGELSSLREQLVAARPLPSGVVSLLASVPGRSPMAVLQTAVAALGLYDAEADDNGREANLRKSVRLTAQMASVVAAFHRLRRGLPVIEPDPELDHAANFLYMLTGQRPDPTSARVMDVALTLHADHEFNASCFAGRVTASTLSDIYSAVAAAVGTLKGPLHGGANEQVMRLLMEIGEPERAAEVVQARLAARERIPGFGHRVYKTWDPRALILKRFSEELSRLKGEPRWYAISLAVEEAVRSAKDLYPNVDFYSASVYHLLGIPVDLFTPVFAVSRISGWTAHLLEQYADNRLIRPRAEYTGPMELRYVPVEDRPPHTAA